MEKAKKSKRPNVIDIAVILILVGAVAFFGWRTLGKEKEEKDMQTMTFVVRVDNIPLESYEDAIKYGDRVQLMTMEKRIDGYVTDHSSVPCEFVQIDKVAGTTTFVTPNQNYVSAYFTVEIAVDAKDRLTLAGSQELRTGRTYILKTEYYEFNGTIISIDRPWVSE